jgi:hypothetical protein
MPRALGQLHAGPRLAATDEDLITSMAKLTRPQRSPDTAGNRQIRDAAH